MEQPFAGYPGRVWATCYQGMAWLSNVIASGSSDIADLYTPTLSLFSTMLNGVNAIDAWQAGALLSIEYQNLTSILALPLSLDIDTATYIETRIAAVGAAASGISALPTTANPFAASGLLAQGQPAIADPGYLEWCMTFQGEVPPVGALLPSGALVMAQSWLTTANAIAALQGSNLTTTYDTAARQYRCSVVVASGLYSLQGGPFLSPPVNSYGAPPLVDSDGNILYDSDGNILYSSGPTTQVIPWNWVVALPTILLDAASLGGSPATLGAQQTMTIRYALIYQMQQLASLLLAMRIHNIVQPATATLRNGESLADLAARSTGNFENWPVLAALNRISPPYPGPTNTDVAMSGRQLFLSNGISTPGVTPDPDNSGISYAANVLGTDWDWGPINGSQPQWTGDIALITGYLNFARSIGRRLQTPLGSLIFHTNYGSRIPPEVGAVQSEDEAARLLRYGQSAINADPRTGSILSSQASVEPGFEANFSAQIVPIGPGATPVSILETIGAVPA